LQLQRFFTRQCLDFLFDAFSRRHI
jgi:hypothetical protein